MGVPVEEAVVEDPLALPPFSAFLAKRACLDFEAIIFQREKTQGRRASLAANSSIKPFSKALVKWYKRRLPKVRRRRCGSTSIFCKSCPFCSSPTKNARACRAPASMNARVLRLLEIATSSALDSFHGWAFQTLGKLLLARWWDLCRSNRVSGEMTKLPKSTRHELNDEKNQHWFLLLLKCLCSACCLVGLRLSYCPLMLCRNISASRRISFV
jgi:hypothetical protein